MTQVQQRGREKLAEAAREERMSRMERRREKHGH